MLPKESEEQIHRYVDTHQTRSINSRERTPFRRQLDFWAFCIAYALAKQLRPLESQSSLRRFTDTRAVQVGDELSEWLAVVAFAKIGHDDPDANDPTKIVEMCNRLAGAGTPHVLGKLQQSFGKTPLQAALEIAESLVEQSIGELDSGA